ncbi:uncharacterized protein LOC129891229 [Solanum dulcamara]|uniref:uncharacterized protein LOC129891229 n=1 Tax=Solanum dulcamara TaxID=45834 RepID=UPI0024855D10|nr:uncharacterized protein LOC129891229 [Solanum dulcamara]
MVVMYFIHLGLFPNENEHVIHKSNFYLVDSGMYETYHCGKVIFEATLKSMRDKIRKIKNMNRIGGLPLAFLTWFYVCSCNLDWSIATRVGTKSPRILNWKVTNMPSLNDLKVKNIDEWKARNICATHEEKSKPYLQGFYDDMRKAHEVHDDFCTPPAMSCTEKYQRRTSCVQAPSLKLDDLKLEIIKLRDKLGVLNDKVTKLNDFVVSSFKELFKLMKDKKIEEFDGDEHYRVDKMHIMNSP